MADESVQETIMLWAPIALLSIFWALFIVNPVRERGTSV